MANQWFMKKTRQLHSQLTNSGWKPSTRESSQLFGFKHLLYMSFGSGSSIYNDICQYQPKTQQWKPLPTTGIVGLNKLLNNN